MPAARRPEPPTRPRDLAPGAGSGSRFRLWIGDALIRLVGLTRASLTLGVRLVSFDDAGRVLLVRHSYLPGWHLPGGAVEPGETANAAVMREAREESGLELAGPPRLLNLYFHRTTGRFDHIAVFVATGAHDAGGAGGLEIRETGRFDVGSLPEGATRATRARIAEALGTEAISDDW